MVFGDSEFGLETFNPHTLQRRWLAAPAYSGYNPLWSPSGQWVASSRDESRDNSIQIVAKDGQSFNRADGCNWVSDKAWAPTEDRLAYLCSEKIGGPANLWLWSMSPKH